MGLWDWDLTTNSVYYSPEWKSQLGYSVQEVSNDFSEWESRVHPEDLAQAKATVSGYLAAPHGDYQNIFRMRHKDGSWRWILAQAFLLTDDSGAPVRMLGSHIDITDRKRQEEALQASEDRFARAFHASPAGLTITRLSDGTFLDVNEAFLAMFEYRREEVVGHTSLELGMLTSESREALIRAQHAAGGLRYAELRARAKSGRTVHIIFSSRPLEIDGEACHVTTMIDMTERKQAESALRRTEELFARTFHTSPIATVLTRLPDRLVLDVNATFERTFGYSKAEVVGRPVSDFPMWDDPGERDAVAALLLKEGAVEGREFRYRTKDGRTGHGLFYAEVFGDSDASYTLTKVVDITERKQAEEKLRLQSSALDAAANAIVITDRDGVIEWVNPAYTALTGYSREEVLGQNPRILKSGVQDEAFYQQLWQTIQAGRVWRSEIVNRRKDGSLYTEEESITPIPGPDGVISHFIGIKHDISERKDAEARIQRHLAQLEALHTIDQAISSILDLRLTLKVLLEQVRTHLGVDAAAVLLYDPAAATLEYAAGLGFSSSEIERTLLRLGEGLAGRAALERTTVRILDTGGAAGEGIHLSVGKAHGFRAYCGVPLIAKGQLKGVLEIYHRTPLDPDPQRADFLETLAGQAAIAIEDAHLVDGLQRANTELLLAYDATIEGWSRAMDLRDKETEGHTQRVTSLTVQLARAAGMTSEEIVQVRRGALLHDMGKLGIPDAILHKATELTDEEWRIMQKHPTYAYEMLSPIKYLRPALDIPYCHHERWDGTGYPRGLKGDQIPLAARLFAVVDVWDALRSDRPYRPGWPERRVLDHLRAEAGTHLDPAAVELFFQVRRKRDAPTAPAE